MASNPVNTFTFEGREVRVIVKEGEPWWVTGDVCSALGIVNVGNALARLDDDEQGFIRNADVTCKGGNPNISIVSESGLYSLILRSRKPEARPFRRWVTHEVLPAIRKTGTYVAPEAASLVEQGNYPAEWKQDAPHKLEQARACSKGSYELLKRFVPTMEAIRAELAMLPDTAPWQQDQLSHEVVYVKERLSHLAGQFAAFDQVIRQHVTVPQVVHAPLKNIYDGLGAVADILERRGDAAPEALLVRQRCEQIAAILPPPDRTPLVPPEASLAGKVLAKLPRHPRMDA